MESTQNYHPYIPFFPHPPPHIPPKVTPPHCSPPSPPKVAPPHHYPSPKVPSPIISPPPSPKVPSPSHPIIFPPPPKVPSPSHPIISPPSPWQLASPVPATPPTSAAKPPTHSRTSPAPIVMPPSHPFLSPPSAPPTSAAKAPIHSRTPPAPIAVPPSHPFLSPPPTPSSGHHQSTVIVAVLVSLGGLLFLAFLSAALCCFLRKKRKVEKSEIAEIDEHVKVQEAIMSGPHVEEVKVICIEDVHIQQDVDKKPVIEGIHKQAANESPRDLNSKESTSGGNNQNVDHEG